MATPHGKYYSNGGNPYEPKPPKPAKPPSANPGASPGLLTSTGGLFGTQGLLITPFFDNINNVYRSITYDPTDFNCEEDCTYYFKQEDIVEEREVTVNKVIITYRELGNAKFFVGVSGYSKTTNKYDVVEKQVIIKVDKVKGADNKIHSVPVDLVHNCVKPQLFIRRKGDSGPLAIARAMMIGKSDEGPQM